MRNNNWKIAGQIIGATIGKFLTGVVIGLGFAAGIAFARAFGF